jgi:murein L,D-transpeptidase YcbB/YkuD
VAIDKKQKRRRKPKPPSIKKFEDDYAPPPTTGDANAGGKATTLTEIVKDDTEGPMLSPLGALGLEAARARYEQIAAAGGWPEVPEAKLKKGEEGDAAAALNRRLFVEGYVRQEATEGEFATVFTTATEEALTRFQRNHGLKVSGTLNAATVKALNVPVERRLAAIRANIPRALEYSKDLGPRYIIVNVPAVRRFSSK